MKICEVRQGGLMRGKAQEGGGKVMGGKVELIRARDRVR